MKVEELTGAELDYWVALADGREGVAESDLDEDERAWGEPVLYWYGSNGELGGTEPLSNYGSPSTDWSSGGPIIERERITVQASQAGDWRAFLGDGTTNAGTGRSRSEPIIATRGDTPLVAAMRAYVASKFGEEVSQEEAQ